MDYKKYLDEALYSKIDSWQMEVIVDVKFLEELGITPKPDEFDNERTTFTWGEFRVVKNSDKQIVKAVVIANMDDNEKTFTLRDCNDKSIYSYRSDALIDDICRYLTCKCYDNGFNKDGLNIPLATICANLDVVSGSIQSIIDLINESLDTVEEAEETAKRSYSGYLPGITTIKTKMIKASGLLGEAYDRIKKGE